MDHLLDRDIHGRGLMLFVRDDIPCKLLSLENKPMEGFYVEINLRKTKWLLCCSYNPSKSNIDFHLEHLNRNLALYSSCYENLMVISDFDVEANSSAMSVFSDTYNLKNLIKEPTCYQNPNKPSCIDLMLTNKPRSFKHSCVIETGLPDFHRMTITVMKATFEKLQPRVVNYRDYKADLLSELSKGNTEENEEGLSDFLDTCKRILDLHVPRKQKYARGNHMPFMNRALSKQIMARKRLRNNFLKDRSEENKRKYSKQHNYCVSLLRKSKSDYFGNLNEKNISDNKTFWKTIKPFLSDKITSTQKTTLIDKEEIIIGDNNTAEVLNTFLSSIVSNLKIDGYSNSDPLANNIRDPILKCIVNYRNHSSILAIGELYNKTRELPFSFSKTHRDDVLSDILKLETFKACQDTDIPTNIVKENADIFANVLVSSFNDSIEKSNFPPILKNANITPVFKKGDRNSKDNYRPGSILPNISKIFERCIFRQLSNYMDQFLSKFQCGFRKGYSIQYCLLSMLGKWKSAVDKGKSFGALLTDLSKALLTVFLTNFCLQNFTAMDLALRH